LAFPNNLAEGHPPLLVKKFWKILCM
jgi:hypothetical protein